MENQAVAKNERLRFWQSILYTADNLLYIN